MSGPQQSWSEPDRFDQLDPRDATLDLSGLIDRMQQRLLSSSAVSEDLPGTGLQLGTPSVPVLNAPAPMDAQPSGNGSNGHSRGRHSGPVSAAGDIPAVAIAPEPEPEFAPLAGESTAVAGGAAVVADQEPASEPPVVGAEAAAPDAISGAAPVSVSPVAVAAAVVERVERGSLADLRQRLEKLPYGHPSSPYHVDGERKPPPPRLKHLELAPPAPNRFAGSVGLSAAGWSTPTPTPVQAGTAADADALGSQSGSAASLAAPPELRPADVAVAAVPLSVTAADDAEVQLPEYEVQAAELTEDSPADPETRADDDAAQVESAYEEPAGQEPDQPRENSSPAGNGAHRAADPAAQANTASYRLPPVTSYPATNGAAPDPSSGNGRAHRHSGQNDRAYGNSYEGRSYREDITRPVQRPAPLPPAPPPPAPPKAPPASVPRTELDGSWSWGSARLSADQARVANDAYDRFRAAEGRNLFGSYDNSGLTVAMRRLSDSIADGRLAPDTEQQALLDPDTFRARFADMLRRYPDRTPERLASRIPGAISYTFIFEPQHYTAGIWEVQDALMSAGYQLLARRNDWGSTTNRCVATMWHDGSHDLPFQVQFHTTASLEAQQLARSSTAMLGDPRLPSAQAEHLRSDLAARWASVPVPPGNSSIGDYRRESEQRRESSSTAPRYSSS
jgi:hypothetical protein